MSYGIHAWLALAILFVAYIAVATEEFTHLRKSKPVLISATLIWLLAALAGQAKGENHHQLLEAYQDMFLEFSELFCFLLVAMTFINALSERHFFTVIRQTLVKAGLTKRQLFWGTGWLTFFISPIADNLTTALLMGAVLSAVDPKDKTFISTGFINIVVAANAGGAFSPFGDVTTLMVWQKGIIEFGTFFSLFIPSAVNFIVPAFILQFWISKDRPLPSEELYPLKSGALVIVTLFVATIMFTVVIHQLFHLPAVFGMLSGLGALNLYGFVIRKSSLRMLPVLAGAGEIGHKPYDIFEKVARAEWDTLLFFYGVMASVAGLAYFGFLADASLHLYGELGATIANSLVGVISAIIDNIPVMYAVLTMQPEMSEAQWLLVTLTAGTGGSLLSIGSAAGVALMGQSGGNYTFLGHLKWSWAIAIGYVASIWIHLFLST